MRQRVRSSAAVVGATALAALVSTAPAGAWTPILYSNCLWFNAKYPHGVGRGNAHDRTSGTPVTDFLHNTRLYNLATHYNKNLDRDHDGIACEKA